MKRRTAKTRTLGATLRRGEPIIIALSRGTIRTRVISARGKHVDTLHAYGPFARRDEGVTWARGWTSAAALAFEAEHALAACREV